jgi:hypothetical protein
MSCMKQSSGSSFRKMGVQVLSYELFKDLRSSEKIGRILEVVKGGDIVMLEGRLDSEIEADLIAQAMANISGKFTGVEVAYLGSVKARSFAQKIKEQIVKILVRDRMGITVIGPSKVIKEIKMDPDKLEVLFK